MRNTTVVLVLLTALCGCKAEEPKQAQRETELVRKPKPKIKETRHTSIRGKEDGPDAASLAAGRAEEAAKRCEGGAGNAELGAGEASDGARDAKKAAKAAKGAKGKGKTAAAKNAAARASKAADKAGNSATWARRMAARSQRALKRAKRAAAEVRRVAKPGHPGLARASKAVARAEKAARAAEAFSKQARKSADEAEAAARAALQADKGATRNVARARARARARAKAKADAEAREKARSLAKARKKEGAGGKHKKRGDDDNKRGGDAIVRAKKKIDPRDIPELPDAPKKEAKGVEIPKDTPTPVAKVERWRQTGGTKGADFCPGGYATSLLHFRIDGILEVRRTFGKGKSKIAQTWRVGYRWSADRSKLTLGEEKVNRPDPASLKGIKLPSMGINMSDATLTFPVTLKVRALPGDRLSVAGRTFVRERGKK